MVVAVAVVTLLWWLLWIVLSFCILVTIIVISVAYFLYPKRHIECADSPPFYESYTALGPLELLLNPLSFIAEKNEELNTSTFATHMLGGRAVFVSDPEHVQLITAAPNEIMSFPDAYGPVIWKQFDPHVLNRHTFNAQTKLLKDYLTDADIKSYLLPSLNIYRQVLKERTQQEATTSACGGGGKTIDLEQYLLSSIFAASSQNMLGSEVLAALNDYPYADAFGAFDIAAKALELLFPPIRKIFGLFRGGVASFDRTVLGLYEAKKPRRCYGKGKQPQQQTLSRRKYPNVLEEIIARHHEKGPETLTNNNKSALLNLVKFFVFGTAFNSYNMLVYFFRSLISNPKLWQELHEEQVRATAAYGATPATPEQLLAKLAMMTKLKKHLAACMKENCFPLLFRVALEDFELPATAASSKVLVIKKGTLVAFSPRIQHANGIDLTFGLDAHPCPAKRYSQLLMLLNSSAILERMSIKKVISARKPENKRLITFPTQPPVIVEYELYAEHQRQPASLVVAGS